MQMHTNNKATTHSATVTNTAKQIIAQDTNIEKELASPNWGCTDDCTL
jgi:hypothetical protein